MKNFSILFLFAIGFLASFTAKAQTQNYISLYGGASIPTGQFSNADYGTLHNENNKAGYAKTGATFGLDAAFYLHSNWAIGGVISYQDQGRLSQKDVQNLSAGYTDAFAVDESTVTATKRYQNLNILVGPQYSFVFSKLTLDLRAEAGLIKSFSTPELKVVLEDPTDPAQTFYQRSSTSSAFAYGASAGLRYRLGSSWGLNLKGSYIGSDGFDITNENRRINAGRLVTKQSVSEIQTTLGLTFQLK
ncbi:MAG TPA: outer membrane beta-barrel protein [Mucilaginibacter sp.]